MFIKHIRYSSIKKFRKSDAVTRLFVVRLKTFLIRFLFGKNRILCTKGGKKAFFVKAIFAERAKVEGAFSEITASN